uniref:Uncharacterized protein n=1 Tax=Panagrolaimus superbus TaxID=310955 RepID=A0A914XR28_9BILA
MKFQLFALLFCLLFIVGSVPQAFAETCRNTDCHGHSAQNQCAHDERMAKWHYCRGIAGKWEECCKG